MYILKNSQVNFAYVIGVMHDCLLFNFCPLDKKSAVNINVKVFFPSELCILVHAVKWVPVIHTSTYYVYEL